MQARLLLARHTPYHTSSACIREEKQIRLTIEANAHIGLGVGLDSAERPKRVDSE